MPPSKFLSLIGGMTSNDGVSLKPPSNVKFYSFQVGPGAKVLSTDPTGNDFGVVDLGSDFRDFRDTASALKQMDLLISVDTSVAHAAGCLGVPCWVMISLPGEWRWLLSGNESVWYRDIRLFRQTEPRNWDNVIVAVLQELQEVSK
jgi:hypothetical protein